MPTSVTWNGTSRSVPNAGELNWSALTGFLTDLGNNAQTTNFQKVGMRVATATPVTVTAATDCVVVTDLASAGAVAVNLPAGVTGQMFCIVDGKGDAATNNITITPASGNINGAATYVINGNRNGIIIAYNGTEWTILAEFIASGTSGSIPRSQISAGTANYVVINDGSGALSEEAQLAVSRGGTGQGTATAAFNALSPITTRGDLITNDGTNDTRLAVGATGRVLTSDGTDPSWQFIVNANVAVGAAISRLKLATGSNNHVVINSGVGEMTSEAQLATSRGGTGQDFSSSTGVVKVSTGTMTAAAVNLAGADVTGTLPIANGGTGQTGATAAFDALAPTTTKGDLIAHNGTDNIRLGVGSDGQVLTAASGQASGLQWTSPLTNPMDSEGDLIVGGASGAATKLDAGTTSQVLRGGTSPSWGSITNTHVDAAAAIDGSKISPVFTSTITNTAGATLATSSGDIAIGGTNNVAKILAGSLTNVGAGVFGPSQSKSLGQGDAADWTVTTTSFASTGGAALCFVTNTVANNSALFVKYAGSTTVGIIWQTGTLYEAATSSNQTPTAGKISIDGHTSQTAVRLRNSSSGPSGGAMFVVALTNGT